LAVYHPSKFELALLGAESAVKFPLPTVPVKVIIAPVHPFACNVKFKVSHEVGEFLAQRIDNPYPRPKSSSKITSL
jgi:hypothetical protein